MQSSSPDPILTGSSPSNRTRGLFSWSSFHFFEAGSIAFVGTFRPFFGARRPHKSLEPGFESLNARPGSGVWAADEGLEQFEVLETRASSKREVHNVSYQYGRQQDQGFIRRGAGREVDGLVATTLLEISNHVVSGGNTS